jgi:tetratricopeptide (TPR) repeat protein
VNKDNILFGIIGLLAGVIIGYLVTSSINRSVPIATPAGPPGVTANPSVELPPDHPPTGGGGAAGGGMQGEVAAAIDRARNEPNDFAAQMKAAGLYYQIKRYESALEFYERAQKIKPNDFDTLTSLGNVTFDLNRYPEAARWYEQALKLRPNDANVRTDLGLTYFLREPRDLDRAISTYRASLGYDPRHEKTLQNLITALLEKGDAASAHGFLGKLEQVNPNNEALAQFRARLGSQ